MFFGTSFRQTILVNLVRKRAHSWDGNVNWAVILNTHNWSERMWTGLNWLRSGFKNRRLKEKRSFLYNHSITKTYLLPSSQQKQSTRRDLPNFVARHCIPQQSNTYHETRVENAKVYVMWRSTGATCIVSTIVPFFASLPTRTRHRTVLWCPE